MSEDVAATLLLPAPGLTLLGSESAMVCEGDFCELPDHLEPHVIARRLDVDAV